MLHLSQGVSREVSHELLNCLGSKTLPCIGLHGQNILRGKKYLRRGVPLLPHSPSAVPVEAEPQPCPGPPLQVLGSSPPLLSGPFRGYGTAAARPVQDEGQTTNLYNLHYFLLSLFRYYFHVLKDVF